jgi:hypothetical protein
MMIIVSIIMRRRKSTLGMNMNMIMMNLMMLMMMPLSCLLILPKNLSRKVAENLLWALYNFYPQEIIYFTVVLQALF